MTVIAHRTRDALTRHPWMLDIADDPAIGPNSVRHFDQSPPGAPGLDVPLGSKLDVLMAVDEYVFGYCLHQRTTFDEDPAATAEMMTYVGELLGSGDFPELARLVEGEGLSETWSRIHVHAHDPRGSIATSSGCSTASSTTSRRRSRGAAEGLGQRRLRPAGARDAGGGSRRSGA